MNKNIKIFVNYFLGPLLFLWLSWSIYNQIRHQSNLSLSWQHISESFHGPMLWNFVLVILLMGLNWSIEAWKWKLAVKKIQFLSFGKAIKAVLSGVSFSVSTPNRMGEYVGRVMYMEEGNRLRAISLSMICSISQLIVTLAMGLTGLIYLMPEIGAAEFISGLWVKVLMYGVMAALLFLTVFYFRLAWLVKWIDRIPGISRYVYLINAIEQLNATMLLQILSLSVIRFVVFGIQYYLVFRLFGVEVGWWQGFWATSITFLVLAIIPTIALLEVVQRSTVALKIFGLLTINQLGIGLTSITVWFINLIIPALAGSLLILGIKIFRNRHEDT